ncbi:MAG TPA: hypothetical protein VHD83_19140 [Puia sp.]|nr:hypothetical protein [Puia sp.]
MNKCCGRRQSFRCGDGMSGKKRFLPLGSSASIDGGSRRTLPKADHLLPLSLLTEINPVQ